MSEPPAIARALAAAGLEVDASSRRRAEYSGDASLYRVLPAAVVFPRTAADVVATLEACRPLGVPVTARGGGTSIAGNAIGTGAVLDHSRHMTRILSIDPAARLAEVEPGVVLDSLQAAAAPHGLRFGPDPSSHSRATLGGMIGNNACGSRALRYGRTSDSVVALDVVLGTGERLVVGAGTPPTASPTLDRLKALIGANLALVRGEFGRFSRQGSGYALEHLLPERRFDVARFLAGSEGTLALILAATLRLTPEPPQRALVVLGYPTLADAADDVPAVLGCEPVAVEGFDAGLLALFVTQHGRARAPRLPDGGAWLLVELGADDHPRLEAACARLLADTSPAGALRVDAAAAAALWRMREDAAGIAARPTAGRAVHAGWEDASVPPASLGAYLRDFERLLVEHGLTGHPYGHFGDGCIHVRLDFGLGTDDGVARFRRFLAEASDLVVGHGGSLSGEHGDGRARSELLARMYSSEALDLMVQVKRLLDPDDVLNPGVVTRPLAVDRDLRPRRVIPVTEALGLRYADDVGDFARAVHRCTGVGKCRADVGAGGALMCPSYLATKDEKDSTRGRARVLQELVSNPAGTDWRSPDVHEALDLCLACKGCVTDCPTGTDMATYKAEVLYQSYRRRPRPAAHYSLGRLPTWAALAAAAPRLANALLGGPLSRPGRRLAGIDPRRDLPRFATQTFSAWFGARPSPAAAGPPVLLWVDTFTNHFAPEVGKAAVRVIEATGHQVRVPDRRLCCGLTYLSTGQLDQARRRLDASMDALAPAVAAGHPVIALEPSCAAVFRHDAAGLLGDAARPGASVRTLAEFLADVAAPLPDLSGRSVVAQPHCHHRAVLGWENDVSLLESAGAEVTSIPGCCGLAGNFGAERGHFDVSRAVAETYLSPAVASLGTDDDLLADGFSCRTQVDQFSQRRARHLAEFLADALEPTR